MRRLSSVRIFQTRSRLVKSSGRVRESTTKSTVRLRLLLFGGALSLLLSVAETDRATRQESDPNLDALHLSCPTTPSPLAECAHGDVPDWLCRQKGCCFNPDAAISCSFPVASQNHRERCVTSPNKLLFSIVVTCHTLDAQVLGQALHSVVQQAFKQWELVIVDDDSAGRRCTDAANWFLREFVPTQRVQTLWKQNGFIADARNFGIQHTSGKYILPLDADDYLSPNFLLEAACALQKTPDLDLLYADQFFFGDGRSKWELSSNISLTDALSSGPLPVTTIYKRDLFEGGKGYRIDMIYGNEDYNFWLSLLRLHPRTLKLPGHSSWYRVKTHAMHTTKAYTSAARGMLEAHNPDLFSVQAVCKGNAIVFCQLDGAADGYRLHQAIEKQPHSCPGWLWLALFKLQANCLQEVAKILKTGISRCRPPVGVSEDVEKLPLQELLRWVSDGAKYLEKARQAREKYRLNPVEKNLQRCQRTFLAVHACTEMEAGVNSVDFDLEDVDYSGRAVIDKIRPYVDQQLHASREPGSKGIPNNVHFVFGLESGPVIFKMIHFIAIRSAQDVHSRSTIYFHCFHEPKGRWWRAIRGSLTLVVHKPFHEFNGRCLMHYAHKADVLRLKVLHEYGGLYLDIDVISLRSWNHLMNESFVMGWQASPSYGTHREGKIYGLCNAAMASERDSLFGRVWQKSYEYFRSCGHDQYWDEHSVILPANLSEAFPSFIQRGKLKLLAPDVLWKPLWDTVERDLLEYDPNAPDVLTKLPDALLVHLWQSGGTSRLSNLENSTDWFYRSPLGTTASKYVYFHRANKKYAPIQSG